jgi:hypothetical protein
MEKEQLLAVNVVTESWRGKHDVTGWIEHYSVREFPLL